MLAPLVAASLAVLSTPSPECLAPPAVRGAAAARPSDIETLYRRGRTYLEFRDAAESRVEAWTAHYDGARVDDAILGRARAVAGTWRLLVVAEDWCGDSANTIPYVAKLVDLAPNLDMRIVDSDAGRSIMESHRTPDGRAATPTVLLLNERFGEAGCWIERPAKLQAWFLANEGALDEEALYEEKYAWYARDAGGETVREIVEMMEAAAAGRPRCAG